MRLHWIASATSVVPIFPFVFGPLGAGVVILTVVAHQESLRMDC